MIKIKVTSFDAEKMLQNQSQMRSGSKVDKTNNIDQSLQKISGSSGSSNNIDQSLPKEPGFSGSRANRASRANTFYRIPPNHPCAKRDKSVSGSLYKEAGSSGFYGNLRLQEAVSFIRKKTAEFPASFKRRSRRQAIAIFLTHWKSSEESFFDRLREAYKDWQKIPFDLLPADLPRQLLESSDEWLDRCYEAAGFGTFKDVAGRGGQ